MGVKNYLRWLKGACSDASEPLKKPRNECSNLYIDMNSLIYQCVEIVNQNGDEPHPNLAETIIKKIDELVKILKPNKRIFISVDGVAPIAKINQQRSRRYAAVPKLETAPFNTCNITPGTLFMKTLCVQLARIIKGKADCDPVWSACQVFFSDSCVPGEGEHKILQFIRSIVNEPGYNHQEISFIYTVDTDMIFLALTIHNPNYRVVFSSFDGGYDVFYINIIRQFLMGLLGFTMHCPEFERALDDYIFLSTFIGNDFFPGFEEIDSYNGGRDFTIDAYREARRYHGGFLVDGHHVDFGFLKTVIHFYVTTNAISAPCEEEEEYIDEMCSSALNILIWTHLYYKCGCVDWDKHYLFSDPPSIVSFMYRLTEESVVFNDNTKPLPSLLQLLILTPPQSANLLPPELQKLVNDDELKPFIPSDPVITGDAYHRMAELPFIDFELFREKYEKLKLSEQDHAMNEIHTLVQYVDGKFVEPIIPDPRPFEPKLYAEDKRFEVVKPKKKSITLSGAGVTQSVGGDTKPQTIGGIVIERPRAIARKNEKKE
jgi:5'-3' exonuclease